MTQHIPTIFRRAHKTIIVRNGQGLRDCCTKAIGTIKSDDDIEGAVRTITAHVLEHRVNNGGRIKEGVFDRLWVLQEVILSRFIQFARCDNLTSISNQEPTFGTPLPSIYNFLEFMLLVRQRFGVGTKMIILDIAEKEMRLNLLNAFIHNGTVCRNQPLKSLPFPSPIDFIPYFNSTRVTSHPRDFILAIMPQYDFYNVPVNAKEMTFGELFVDCFQQGRKSGWDLTPLIPADNIEPEFTFPLTDNIPEPVCLGGPGEIVPRSEAGLSRIRFALS